MSTRPYGDVSWARMIRAVEMVKERLLRAASALDKAGVPYAVVGGNAVAAWVSRVDEAAVRNTREVDVLLRRSDLEAAKAALDPEDREHVRLVTGDPTESESTPSFRLIGLEALVRMKLASFRIEDRVHLRDLISVGLVDETWTDRFSEDLAARLREIIDNPED